MVDAEALLANRPVQVIAVLVMFAAVYAIFYKPVLRMLGEHLNADNDGAGTGQATEADRHQLQSTQAPERIAAEPPTRHPWYRDRLLPLTIATVLIIDQVSKYLVRANLALYESWPRDGFFRFTYGTNTGTAFGLFPNQTVVLIVASFLAIGFLFYFYRSQALSSRVLRLAIGLQLGGAFGNLVDRLRGGAVTDFIDVGWWPIFNLADSSIVIGIGLLLATVMVSKEPESDHQHASPIDESGDPAEDPLSEPDS